MNRRFAHEEKRLWLLAEFLSGSFLSLPEV
jgi:hypothetical protein